MANEEKLKIYNNDIESPKIDKENKEANESINLDDIDLGLS
jgi:hypothetical protein